MASPTPGKTQLGVEPNIAGLLCYAPCCVGLVFSIVAVIVEKSNRFVRFHAFQSLLVHGIGLVLWFGFLVLGAVLGTLGGFLGLILVPFEFLIGFGFLGLTIFLMVKAYGNESFELPMLGEQARNWANQ